VVLTAEAGEVFPAEAEVEALVALAAAALVEVAPVEAGRRRQKKKE
jgi:hypothetical protein